MPKKGYKQTRKHKQKLSDSHLIPKVRCLLSKLAKKRIGKKANNYIDGRSLKPDYWKTHMVIYYSSIRGKWNKIRESSRRLYGKFLKIDFKEFEKWFLNQTLKCRYCHRKLSLKTNTPKTRLKSLSFDRKNNKKGYFLKNIVLACYKCNAIKSNILSYKEMIEIGKVLQRLGRKKCKKEKR